MALKLKPPFPPMEALSVAEAPLGPEWQYEPKWDGFRCLAFRDGAKVYLQSKSGRPLARYFPDVVAAVLDLKPTRFVLDGEIAIPIAGQLSFDDLLLRLHPAESRVRKLAAEHPAIFIVFDLLEDSRGKALVNAPLHERRKALEVFAANFAGESPIRLSPATDDLKAALKWFKKTGGNLDGIVAKRLDLDYRSGLRDGMQKVKHRHTVDCVVGGLRYAQKGKLVGSLLLGLFNSEGQLDHVGFTSAFKANERAPITKLIEPLIGGKGFSGKRPDGPSRWSNRASDDWQPLKPKLVVEVEYDHFTGGRFRHGAQIVRWRPDKDPEQCTVDQLKHKGGKLISLLESSPSRASSRSRQKRSEPLVR